VTTAGTGELLGVAPPSKALRSSEDVASRGERDGACF
jgi:hypothetical protein